MNSLHGLQSANRRASSTREFYTMRGAGRNDARDGGLSWIIPQLDEITDLQSGRRLPIVVGFHWKSRVTFASSILSAILLHGVEE